MAELPKDAEPEESFAELLKDFSPESRNEPRIGDRVTGKIISIGKDTIFVDCGLKMDAVVDRSELDAPDAGLELKEGDEIALYVAALAENEVRLSRAISGAGGIQVLRDAYHKSAPVEGKVKEVCKGGFLVEVMQHRAFCPLSQIAATQVEDPGSHVGETYQFLITRFEEKGRNIVVSRRSLLDRELDVVRKKFMETLEVDAILDGRIVRVLPFGAFIAIAEGVEGLAHVSELSWSKTSSPDEMLHPGDRVRVKVIGIDAASGAKQPKIALSIKQLQEDPWLSIEEKFQIGEAVRGKVTRCMDFGAFVEIAPGIEGLVHISEMSYTRRVHKPADLVAPGDAVTVVVKGIELDRRRISLSLRDAEGDPWAEVLERFTVGQRTQGILEKKEKFGYFISLAPGITGLLPLSVLRKSPAAGEMEKAKEGDSLAVAIAEINLPKRRISLAPASSEEEGDWQRFSNPAQESLGSMAEKLQIALARKRKNE